MNKKKKKKEYKKEIKNKAILTDIYMYPELWDWEIFKISIEEFIFFIVSIFLVHQILNKNEHCS